MEEQVNHFYDVVQTDDARHFKCKLCGNATRHDVTVNARYRHLFRKHKDAWNEHLQSVRGPKKTPKPRHRNEVAQGPSSVSAESSKPTTPNDAEGTVEDSAADLNKRIAHLLNSVGTGSFSEFGNEASSSSTANIIDAGIGYSTPGPVPEDGLTNLQFPHHVQFQPESRKHAALDDGTESLTFVKRFRPLIPTENTRLPPVDSLLKTTTESSYTHATTGFSGGELLSYGRSENVAAGPLSSLELKLDRVIDLLSQVKDSVNQNGNMMAMLLRSNSSGNLF